MTEVKEYSVENRYDFSVIEFTGSLIGFGTTKSDQRYQWTEVIIYKTTSSKYVVQRLGQSVLYHDINASCASGEVIKGSEIKSYSEPCLKCDPEIPEDEGFDKNKEFKHEVTWSSADMVEQPSEIRDVLMVKKPGKKPFLSSVSYQAIQNAIKNDPSLIGVFEKRYKVD